MKTGQNRIRRNLDYDERKTWETTIINKFESVHTVSDTEESIYFVHLVQKRAVFL